MNVTKNLSIGRFYRTRSQLAREGRSAGGQDRSFSDSRRIMARRPVATSRE